MHPTTLYMASESLPSCFVIFAAFKESMTLNLAQRSFKVIHFGGNRKPVHDFIYAVNTNSNFRSIFICQFYIRPREPIFPYPTSIWAKSPGCYHVSFGVDP